MWWNIKLYNRISQFKLTKVDGDVHRIYFSVLVQDYQMLHLEAAICGGGECLPDFWQLLGNLQWTQGSVLCLQLWSRRMYSDQLKTESTKWPAPTLLSRPQSSSILHFTSAADFFLPEARPLPDSLGQTQLVHHPSRMFVSSSNGLTCWSQSCLQQWEDTDWLCPLSNCQGVEAASNCDAPDTGTLALCWVWINLRWFTVNTAQLRVNWRSTVASVGDMIDPMHITQWRVCSSGYMGRDIHQIYNFDLWFYFINSIRFSQK